MVDVSVCIHPGLVFCKWGDRIQWFLSFFFSSSMGRQGTFGICQTFVPFLTALGQLLSATVAPRGGGSSEQSLLCLCYLTVRLSCVFSGRESTPVLFFFSFTVFGVIGLLFKRKKKLVLGKMLPEWSACMSIPQWAAACINGWSPGPGLWNHSWIKLNRSKRLHPPCPNGACWIYSFTERSVGMVCFPCLDSSLCVPVHFVYSSLSWGLALYCV